MNVIDFITFKVLIDYGHNVPAVEALGRVLPHISNGRKIVVAHGTGNRLDEQIKQFGAALAGVYDQIIITDLDPRQRKPGEAAELVLAGALEAGFLAAMTETVLDPMAAIDRAFAIVQSGDLIVVQVDDVEPVLKRVMEHFNRVVAPPIAPGV